MKIALVDPRAQLPQYSSEEAAGLDLYSIDTATLRPGARRLFKTGVKVALSPGTEAQIRPRSGLALKHGVTVLNAPGTVDADYRGEIGVLLVNHGTQPYQVTEGDRIAQLVVADVLRVEILEVVSELEETARGDGGFGSTGV